MIERYLLIVFFFFFFWFGLNFSFKVAFFDDEYCYDFPGESEFLKANISGIEIPEQLRKGLIVITFKCI